MKTELTLEQNQIKENLYEQAKEAHDLYASDEGNGLRVREVLNKMAANALKLVQSLPQPPKFSVSIRRGANGLSPDDPEFYRHLHVIEELLCSINGISLEELKSQLTKKSN